MKPRRLHSATTLSIVTTSSGIAGEGSGRRPHAALGTPILGVPMPIYVYRCENDHTFEVMQRMSDDPVSTCEVCGAPVQRVFQPVAVHFKGKGFYNTDYGTRNRQRELKDSAESGANDHADKQKDKKDAKDAKSSSSSSSSSSSDGGSSSGSPKPKKDSSTTAS